MKRLFVCCVALVIILILTLLFLGIRQAALMKEAYDDEYRAISAPETISFSEQPILDGGVIKIPTSWQKKQDPNVVSYYSINNAWGFAAWKDNHECDRSKSLSNFVESVKKSEENSLEIDEREFTSKDGINIYEYDDVTGASNSGALAFERLYHGKINNYRVVVVLPRPLPMIDKTPVAAVKKFASIILDSFQLRETNTTVKVKNTCY